MDDSIGAEPSSPRPVDPAALRTAIALVQAHLDGDQADVDRLTAGSAEDQALLLATASVAATLARAVGLYGHLSPAAALALVDPGGEPDLAPKG